MDKELIKLEYEKAQDSAEHYNTMTWTLISIIFAFSLLVIRTILLDINSSGWQFSLIGKWTVISGLLLIASLSWLYFGYLIEGANQKKKWKYIICQKIEESNKELLGQHLGTKELPFTKRELGIELFVWVKTLFIIFFMFLSYMVLLKSYNTDEFLFTISLFVLNFLTFIAHIIYEYSRKKRFTTPETILLKVKGLQNKFLRKN